MYLPPVKLTDNLLIKLKIHFKNEKIFQIIIFIISFWYNDNYYNKKMPNDIQ